MMKDTFFHEWKGQSFRIGDWLLNSKLTIISNKKKKKKYVFKNMEDAYNNAVIGGKSLKTIVSDSSIDDLFKEEGNMCIDDSGIQIMTPEETIKIYGKKRNIFSSQ